MSRGFVPEVLFDWLFWVFLFLIGCWVEKSEKSPAEVENGEEMVVDYSGFVLLPLSE